MSTLVLAEHDNASLKAAQALSTRLVEAASMDERMLELQRALDLEHPPRRIECRRTERIPEHVSEAEAELEACGGLGGQFDRERCRARGQQL